MATNAEIREQEKILKEIISLKERISNLDKQSANYQREANSLNRQIERRNSVLIEQLGSIEKIEKTITAYKKQRTISQEEALKFEDQILNTINKNIDAVLDLKLNQKDLFELTDTQRTLLTDITSLTAASTGEARNLKKEYQGVVNVNQELANAIDQTVSSIKNVGTSGFKPTDFDGLIDKMNKLSNSTNNQVLDEAIQKARALSDEYKQMAEQLNEVNEAAIRYRQTIDGIGRNSEDMINKINGFIKKNLPGGGLIARMFGFNTLGRDFRQAFGKNFNDIMMESIKKNPMQKPDFFSTMLSALGRTIKQLLPRLLAFAVSALGAAVVFFMNMLDKLVSKIVKDMGITRQEAAGFARDTQVMAAELGAASIYAEQLVESANKIREGLGGIDIAARVRSGNLVAQELVKTGAVLSDKFDLSGQELGGLALTGVMFNKSLTQTTNITANMAKGVRSVKDSLKDMANIPAKISAGFAGSIVQLAAMVNKAKLLGTSVESIRNMAEGLLDIETSVSKQFEAQVLTGRQMDFDRARYFSLMGREDMAFDEVLNQVGSLQEFKRFTPIAQKSIAEAAGFDVEEMSRILGRQELIQKLGISKQEFDSMLERGENIATLIEKRKNEGLVSEEDYSELRKLSEEYDSTTILEKLKRMAITLGNALALLLEPLVNFLRDFLSRGGDNVIRGIGYALAKVAQVLLSFANLFGGAGGGVMLGGIAGAVIGSFFGAPLIGAGIGAAIGGVVGIGSDMAAPAGYDTGATAMAPAISSVQDPSLTQYRAQLQQPQESNQYLSAIASSLQSIDQQTRTPAVVRIGDKSVTEIGTELSLKKNMTLGLDNTFDSTLTSNYRA